MEETRRDIVNTLISHIPSHFKPVEYLMDKLKVSKVSAYRRLNGKIPFTYDEVFLLAQELNFSVDELIHYGSGRKFYIEFADYFDNDVHNIILKSLLDYYDYLLLNSQMEKVSTLETINNLWFIYTLFQDNLFRFFYYKYLQQYDITFSKLKMKDINIPSSVYDVKEKIVNTIIDIDNTLTTSILDRHIFFNTMTEIQYYYRRGFLEEDELNLIAKDIKDLLVNIEKGAINGEDYGRRFQYFIGQKNIYSNSAYVQNDNQIYSFFLQNELHPIVCYNQRLCILHYNFLLSQKRQSILISSSNQELQISFFEKQHEYLRKLEENRDLIII